MSEPELIETAPVEISKGYNTYTNEDRMNFAVAYVITGNVAEIARKMNLPDKTLYGWLKSDWWPRFYDEAKRQHAELIEARLSDVVEKATNQLIDRIEHGDEVVARDGTIVTVKVSARDLNTIIRDSVDKIRLLQNKPGRLTAEIKFDASEIERNFAKLAERHHDRIVAIQ